MPIARPWIPLTSPYAYPGTLPAGYVRPSGSDPADDAALQAALNTPSAFGDSVILPGNLALAVGHKVPTCTTLEATCEDVITSAIPVGDGHSDSPLWIDNGFAILGTFSADVSEGARFALVTTTAGAQGKRLWFYRGGDVALQFDCVGVGETGTTDISNGALYGGGTLNGLTLELNVNGTGMRTLALNGGTNAANEAALLAAILVEWPELRSAVAGPERFTGKHLVLTASSSVVVGPGTANAALGLAAPSPTVETDIPIAFAFKTGDEIYVAATPNTGTTIDLGNATLQGTGGRAWWFLAPRDLVIENVNVESSYAHFGPDIDLGSRRATMRDIVAKWVAGSAVGAAIEAGEDGALESVHAVGAWGAGIQISGKGVRVLHCTSHCSIGPGLILEGSGATDIFAARQCSIIGGTYDGSTNGDGVYVSANSVENVFVGVCANYNAAHGFRIVTGTQTAVTTGASRNRFIGCVARGNHANGFAQGPDFLTPLDSNAYVGCVSSGNGEHGLSVWEGTALVSDFTSDGDGWAGLGGAIATTDNGSAIISGLIAKSPASASTWIAISHGSNGIVRARDCEIDGSAGSGTHYGVYAATNGAVLYIDNVKVTGCYYGLKIEAGFTATVHIGPGCEFDSNTAPIVATSGTITMVQTGGAVAIPGAAATSTLTFAQHYCTAIEIGGTTPIAAGAQVVNAIHAFPGQSFIVKNSNTAASTTTVFGVVVPVGATYLIRCNSAGVWEHVTLS